MPALDILSKLQFREIGRRPLFYAAILFSTLILLTGYFVPAYLYQVPKNDVYWIARQDPESVLIRGRIISEVERKVNYYHQKYDSFVLECDSVDWEGDAFKTLRGKVRVTVRDPAVWLRYGDQISLSGKLALPDGPRNPGGFDARAYLDRQGIRGLFFAKKDSAGTLVVGHRPHFITEYAIKFRNFLSQKLAQEFKLDDAAFLKALLLGEKRELSDEFESLFVRTGTMHLLAVSGFNVGFLTAALLFILSPFRIPKKIRWVIVLAVIWAYCVMVGWQAPLVRASVMATVLIVAKLLGRKQDLLNSLGLAALLILASNPKNIFDIGFQLSFAAVAGMALFMPIFMPKKELFPNEKMTFWEKSAFGAQELFWVSFVATLTTLPLTVQYFYMVTPLSLAANMVAVPLSFCLFFCGLVYFLCFWWVPPFLFFIPWILKSMMLIFTCLLSWISRLPFSVVIVGKMDLAVEIVLIAGLSYLLFSKKIKSRFFRALLLIIFSMNVFLFQEALRYFDRRFAMTVLDVGQGDAIYFEFPKGGNLLIDAGKGQPHDKGRHVVGPYLKSRGIRSLDALVISHPQEDHIGGMSALLEDFSVAHVIDAKKVYFSGIYQLLQKNIRSKMIDYCQAARGSSLKGFSDVRVDIFSPPAGKEASKNINNDCLILKITYGKTSFLLTGDIEDPAMRSLMESGLDLHADVLKVPHHGAKPRKEAELFFQSVAPRVSVISVGQRNSYGHPRKETLELLSSIKGNQIFRTDQQGAVRVVSDGTNLTVTIFVQA